MQTAVLCRVQLRRTSKPAPSVERKVALPPTVGPSPASRETIACLAMSAVAAHVRGLSVDALLDAMDLRAEVAGLLRGVAGEIEPWGTK